MSEFRTLLVEQFFVIDDNGGLYSADNPQSFEDSLELLGKKREENPDVFTSLVALIDA